MRFLLKPFIDCAARSRGPQKFGADIRAFPAAALADEHGSMSDKRTSSGRTSAKVTFWADSGRAASIEQAVFAYRAKLSGLSQIRNNLAGFEIQ